MPQAKTTSATTLRLLAEALEDLGADWRLILKRCDIDPEWLLDPEVRIPQANFESVWKEACVQTGNACIGLHAGERVRPHAVNLFGYLMLSSATVGDGLRRVARYQGVLTGKAWLSMEAQPSGVRLLVGLANVDPDIHAIHAEYVAALVLQVTAWVSEQPIAPVEVRFSHEARCDEAEYRRILRGPVVFGAERCELVFGPGVLEYPSMHANERFAQLHERFAAQLLARQQDTSFAGRVRQHLIEQLETGPPDRSSVAKRLALSDRSLQRRLREEGTSFRAVLDECRRDLAREQLQSENRPIAEVAYLTGFAEVSSFTRAVHRWFGCTPRQLRRDHESNP